MSVLFRNAERLRSTISNAILVVEPTGPISAIPLAKKLGIPLVFVRKSRPIPISTSSRTSSRSVTRGTTSTLVVRRDGLDVDHR